VEQALEPTTPDETEAPPPVKYMRQTGEAIMADPTGEVYTIDPSKVEEAHRSGWRPVSEMEYESAKEGGWGTARAFVEGAARTVIPVNVFDPLAVEASRLAYGEKGAELARQQLREDEIMHPTATFAGEIAGSLAPLALGLGGGSAAVTGETALARAGQRFLAAAPTAFGYGAAAGFSQQVHEDVLGNHELAAQKYLASTMKGGLMGVLLGGGLSAGLGHVGDKLAGLRPAQTATKVEGGAVRAIERAAETEANPLARAAEEQAFKGIGAKLKDIQKLGRNAEEATARMQRIGRTLIDEGVSTATAGKAEQATRLTARVGEVGAELGALRRGLEKAAVRPSAENILQRIESDVVKPLVETPFSGAEQNAVRGYLQEIVDRIGGRKTFDTFEELHTLRRALDKKLDPKLWSKVPGSAPPAAQELGKIRGILEDEFERAAEAAAAELGEETLTQYATKKAIYADLKTAEKIASKEAARGAANRAISLTDTIAGAGGFVALGPKGIAFALANKAMREYGNQVASAALERASTVDGIARAAAKFDERLNQSVLSFFGKSKAPALARSTERVSPEAARALRDATRSPAVLADRVASAVSGAGLRDTAPRVTQAMTGAIMRAATWIQAKLPPEPPPRGLAFGPSKPRPVGPRAQKEIDNAFRALDGDAFMDDLARGRVDRQALEAMKFINPELHGEIVGKLRQYGLENQPDLSRQQAVALSIITGEPMTPLMQPKVIQGFQQAYAQEGPAHDPSAPGQVEKKQIGSGGPPPGRAQSTRAFASGTDKMEASNGE
jgi:hypothetical protein